MSLRCQSRHSRLRDPLRCCFIRGQVRKRCVSRRAHRRFRMWAPVHRRCPPREAHQRSSIKEVGVLRCCATRAGAPRRYTSRAGAPRRCTTRAGVLRHCTTRAGVLRHCTTKDGAHRCYLRGQWTVVAAQTVGVSTPQCHQMRKLLWIQSCQRSCTCRRARLLALPKMSLCAHEPRAHRERHQLPLGSALLTQHFDAVQTQEMMCPVLLSRRRQRVVAEARLHRFSALRVIAVRFHRVPQSALRRTLPSCYRYAPLYRPACRRPDCHCQIRRHKARLG